MSSERDPLLTAPQRQHDGSVQNSEGVRKDKRLGPLEISRSNRRAILTGIWTANFLGVRIVIPYSLVRMLKFCAQSLNSMYPMPFSWPD